MSGLLTRVLRRVGVERRISYEDSKRLARAEDTGGRRKLAANQRVRPELLYFLADDPEPEVRREIAANPSTPVQADLILARDGDESVRHDLALKIARLAPDLNADQQSEAAHRAAQVLEILVRDQLTQIRRILADALKDLPTAPVGAIRRLARDPEIEVAGPILQFSPLLNDEDLLEIIGAQPIAGALSAIARRQGLAAPVVDSIVAADDISAITALLDNRSAQIREETLDLIVNNAPPVEPWHGPLVRRPKLSSDAIVRISRFVADSLIQLLQQRADLDPETTRHLGAVIEQRLAKTEERLPPPTPVEEARHLHSAGDLTEERLTDALGGGQRAFLIEALALLSAMPRSAVDRVLSSQSNKAVTALSWKAGLSMRFAVALQNRVAHIPPSALLNARNGIDYPLSEDDMIWQLEFFAG